MPNRGGVDDGEREGVGNRDVQTANLASRSEATGTTFPVPRSWQNMLSNLHFLISAGSEITFNYPAASCLPIVYRFRTNQICQSQPPISAMNCTLQKIARD